MSDPISEKLASLRTDVDQLRYAPAGSIRSRGRRRSVLQVGGSLVVVAALVGGGFVLLPDRSTDPDVANTPSPSATQPATITPGALLTADALPTSDPSNGPWLELANGTDPSVVLADQCGPSSQFGGGSPQFVRTFTSNGTEVGAYTAASESLLVDADPSAAAARAEALAAVFGGCGAADGVVTPPQTWTLQGAADGATLIEVARPESATTPGGYTYIAVARTGPVTVVTTLAITSPEPIRLDDVLALVHDALAKVCTTGLPCPDAQILATPDSGSGPTEGSPSSSPTPTSSASAEAGFDASLLLRLQDLPTWDDQLKWASADDVDPAGSTYGNTCTPLWRDLGATTELMREFQPGGKSDPTYTDHSGQEVIADFPDDAAAANAMKKVVQSVKACESSPDADPDLTVDRMEGAAPDTAWVISFPSEPGARTMMYTGIARVGNRTALVMVQYLGNGDLLPEPFVTLLAAAADRLGTG